MSNVVSIGEHPAMRALLARMGDLTQSEKIWVDHLRHLLRDTSKIAAANDSPVEHAIMAVVNDDSMSAEALKGWCAGIFLYWQMKSPPEPPQAA